MGWKNKPRKEGATIAPRTLPQLSLNATDYQRSSGDWP